MTTSSKKRWSQHVTEKSDALDLDKGRVHLEESETHRCLIEAFGGA